MKLTPALTSLLLLLVPLAGLAQDAPLVRISFDQPSGNRVREEVSGVEYELRGSSTPVTGVAGGALRFDGFTTELVSPPGAAPLLEGGFTIEAWLAPGAYPWNWCPIVTQREAGTARGFALELGPRGELRLGVGSRGEWLECSSSAFVVPLRRWTHVAATCEAGSGVTLWIDGEGVGEAALAGPLGLSPEEALRIGTIAAPEKPSNIHREFGTVPAWFSFDGILDEVVLHGRALEPDAIVASCGRGKAAVAPDLPPRRLPSGPSGRGRFGAYYCRLEYYPEWDALWPVDADPDIVVRFDESDARVVFWRGSRYSAAWVTGNELWMADQSVEAWNEVEGCYEHMQDRHCRYSHVRIIESSDARVVVHWRYAPVTAHDHLWRVNEKTGRACWVDEYYTIYPDLVGVRKPTWKTGTLGHPRQFQESIPFTHPGQVQGDVVEAAWCTVANLAGDSAVLRHTENPRKQEEKDELPDELTIQLYHLKSPSQPFIVFERGNRMQYLSDRHLAGLSRPGSCNHWPVGQARCDGRTSQATDRPASFLGFPISDPPVHEEGGRSWWSGLYGMTELSIEELAVVGRSWAQAPELRLGGNGFVSEGYDRGQRAYLLRRAEGDAPDTRLYLELSGTNESPVHNPALVVKGWGDREATLAIDGLPVARGSDFRYGLRRRLESADLVVWMRLSAERPVSIELKP